MSEVDLKSEQSSGDGSSGSKKTFEVDEAVLQDVPHFYRHSEATNAELFYDLFFVANLNVFTGVHEVNDPQTLAQYVGFFCILWFTWYQVSLYDVRFNQQESLFERAAKALQFGVMIGFATVGPNFDVGRDPAEEDGYTVSTFKELSLILMASRLVLVVQYLQSLWFTRAFARTRIPMTSIAATYLAAAAVYFALFFSYKPGGNSRYLYTAWYGVAVLETAIVTAISSSWRVVSFKGTHLTQRMSLLTLIILGEGVIGLAKQCQAIVTSEIFEFTASTIGDIVSAVMVLYFLFLIYFDWLPQGHFGSIRQQIWAFLHFPLHIFLVLAAEGLVQAIAWRAAISKINNVAHEVMLASADPDVGVSKVIEALTGTSHDVLKAGYESMKGIESMTKLNSAQTSIAHGLGRMSNAASPEDVTTGSVLVFESLQAVIFQVAGFEPPRAKRDAPEAGAETDQSLEVSSAALSGTYKVFVLAFCYFFVSIGLAIVLNSFLSILCERKRSRIHWIRWTINILVGMSLCLVTVISYTAYHTSSNAYDVYSSSPWVIPTVTMALAFSVAIRCAKLPGMQSETG